MRTERRLARIKIKKKAISSREREAISRMVKEAALLAIWLIGLFGIVCLVIACVWRAVKKDSFEYDEQFVWKKRH